MEVRKKIFLLFSIVVLLFIAACEDSSNTSEIENDDSTKSELSESDDLVYSFKYLGKDISELSNLQLVKNGAQRNLSSLGFSGNDCAYYRSNYEIKEGLIEPDRLFFTCYDNQILAFYTTFSNKTVKDFLNNEYNYFKDKEPNIVSDGVSVTLYWAENEKMFCLYCVNNNYPSFVLEELNVIICSEYYSDKFVFDVNSKEEHPIIVYDFMNYAGFNINDFDCGSAEINNTLYDVYSTTNLWLYFDLEEPYTILTSKKYMENLKEVIWINSVKTESLSELENYLEYYGFSIDDVSYSGTVQIHDKMHYEYKYNDYDSYLYVCSEYPYSIYTGRPNSHASLSWENGEPITRVQKTKRELAETLYGMAVLEQYNAVIDARQGMYYDEWRDLGELQPDCEEITYLEDFYDQFYQYKYVDGQGYVYMNIQEKGFSSSEWIWAYMSQGIIYIE